MEIKYFKMNRELFYIDEVGINGKELEFWNCVF